MTLPPTHTETLRISAYDCDFLNRWKPVNILQSMQLVANSHAAALGFGFDAMTERGLAWIFSRFKIRFYRFPSADELVTIQTAPRGISQKIFFRRDFRLSDEQGRPVASATTAWLLLDRRTWRMLAPTALDGPLPDPTNFTGLDEILEKIPVPESGLEERLTVTATYSMVDVLEHVNNTRYVEWACDSFDLEHHRAHSLDWLQINYANEVKAGERVQLGVREQDGQPGVWQVAGTNLATGKRAFEALVGWKKVS